MKEKIGIEKLIELLNKFEREVFPEEHEYVKFPDGTDDDGGYWYYKEQPNIGENKGFNYSSSSNKRNCEINQLLIISKEFGFIKWLVDNEKVNPYDPSYNVPTHIALGVDDGDGDFMVYERFFKEDELLMLLSIQDEPINFLVSILK